MFFIFNLCILYIVSYYFWKVLHTNRRQIEYAYIFFVISTVAVVLIPLFALKYPVLAPLISYVNPLNYLPFVFLSIPLLKPEKLKFNLMKNTLYSFTAYLILAFFEWKFMFNDILWVPYQLPPYMRASLIFGALTAFYISLMVKKRPGGAIKYLSIISLGVYFLHFHFIDYSRVILTFSNRLSNFMYSFAASTILLSLLYPFSKLKSLKKYSYLFFRNS